MIHLKLIIGINAGINRIKTLGYISFFLIVICSFTKQYPQEPGPRNLLALPSKDSRKPVYRFDRSILGYVRHMPTRLIKSSANKPDQGYLVNRLDQRLPVILVDNEPRKGHPLLKTHFFLGRFFDNTQKKTRFALIPLT